MKEHAIKIQKQYFDAVSDGSKTFEIRNNDRNYKQGDSLFLIEINKDMSTGRELTANVGYVCDYEQKEGYVVFSLIDVQVN